MAFPAGSTRQKLTIDNTKVSGSVNLTDFPTLIKGGNILDAAYAAMEGDGDDIRFTTDEAGLNQIPFEIVNLDAGAKTCQIWAKEPDVADDADTAFYIWFGDAALSAYAVGDTYGRNNVWSDYGGVFHMEEASNATLIDSSGNQNSISNTLDTITGKIDLGMNSTSGEVASLGNVGNFTEITLQAWGKRATAVSEDEIMSKWGTNKFVMGVGSTANHKPFVKFITAGGENVLAGASDFPNAIWAKITGIWHSTTGGILVINGISVDTDNANSGNLQSSTDELAIGALNDAGVVPWEGDIDEVRYREGTITVAWDLTEYNNQNSPSTFITGSDIFTPVSAGRPWEIMMMGVGR